MSDKDGRVIDVLWDGPAFKAGLAPNMQILAVDGKTWSRDVLADALRAAAQSKQPISLLVKNLGYVSTLKLDWTGGLRYPVLQRVAGMPDRLDAIAAPRR